MRRCLLFPFMWLLAFTVTACGNDSPEPEEPEDRNENSTPTPGNNNRYLVLYCSRSGNTEALAEAIRNALDCDILEVLPATPYDENYNAMLTRSQREQAEIEQGNFPPIRTSVRDLEGYDIIFIGYPVWYGHMATPMQTFLHDHADLLTGKQIALFATSGSSGITTSVTDARTHCPGATFTATLLLTSGTLSQMQTHVTTWLGQLEVSQ